MKFIYKALIVLEILCLLGAGLIAIWPQPAPQPCENCNVTYNATINATTTAAVEAAVATPKPKVIKILYFHQDGCEFCAQQQPVIDHLAKYFNVTQINLSNQPNNYNIKTTPTTIVYVDGVEHRLVNVQQWEQFMAVING